MKITNINDYEIRFDNGKRITFDHVQDCCERNYAQFEYLKEELDGAIFDMEFQEPLVFEHLKYGFNFGNHGKMFFIPCYSAQNGYYSRGVDIYFDDELVLDCEGELI